MKTHESPEKLVSLLRDPQTLGEGYTAILAEFGRLFRWYSRVYGATEAEAEDFAEDLITRIVVEKIDRFNGDGSQFVGWVLTLMRHEAVNWYRERNRLRTQSIEGHPELAIPEVLGQVDPVGIEIRRILQPALETLSDRDRQLFEARALDGKSHAEIAEELGMNMGTVKVNYKRIRDRLKEQLKEQEANLFRIRRIRSL
jgi:RNA polymerase sigma factor (sigma-70 family)